MYPLLLKIKKLLTVKKQCVTISLQFGTEVASVEEMEFYMPTAVKEKASLLEYKGHQLRRKDNLIYYGSMTDKYIIMLQVTETKQHDDLNIATRIVVQLQYTDPDLKSRDRVVKKSEKTSFFEAIDVAAVWLERALAAG